MTSYEIVRAVDLVVIMNLVFLILQLSTPFDTAVDVGCGSGKSTEALSPYFKNVIGLDSSDVRVNYAYKSGGLYNIIYRLVWKGISDSAPQFINRVPRV